MTLKIKMFLFLFLLPLIAADEKLISCNCGNYVGVGSIGENNEIKIDESAIRNLLDNEAVRGRRFYLVGNFGETEIIDGLILKELYTNVSEFPKV